MEINFIRYKSFKNFAPRPNGKAGRASCLCGKKTSRKVAKTRRENKRQTSLTWGLLAIFFCAFILNSSAQSKIIRPDSTTASTPDTLKTDTVAPKHRHLSEPDKAAIKSAIIPGWGQITHKDTWWHVPIIYAGFAVFGYFIWWNNQNYDTFRNAYRQRIATELDTNNRNYDIYNVLNPVKGPKYQDQGLLDSREYYRRNRDLLIIVTSVYYLANILDAYVFTHLREFDISNDLTMRIQPLNISMLGNQPVVSCGLKFNLR